jgi:UPF0271 protein
LLSYGDLALLAPYGSVAIAVAQHFGVEVATEAFADRAYRPDGRLAPRSDPGAVVSDATEVADQAVALALEHRVRAVDGSWIPVTAASICIHGDTPGSASLAREVHDALTAAGVALQSFVT